jgi:sporulation protein YqfC
VGKHISMELKKRIVKTFELPKEIILDLPRVMLIGNEELSIDNYKGIIEYQPELLRINTGAGILYIEGKNLCLKQITAEQIKITGCILNLAFNSN